MAQTLKTRQEIDPALTWNLQDIFESDEQWESLWQTAREAIDAFPSYQGTLAESPASLLAALTESDRIELMLERLYVYARMHRDEDNAVAKYQGMADRAMQLNVAFGEKSAFLTPEIVAMDEEKLLRFIDDDCLKTYRHGLENLNRKRAHALSEPEERLLALASEPLNGADTIFTMLNNVDITFGTVENEQGENIELSHGNFRIFLESQNREVRKNAFETFYASFERLKNTLAASYATSVKTDVFYARARRYDGALAGALFGNNVPVSVYDGVIEAVHERLGSMQEYLALRKKALGVEQLHMYDLYVPMVKDIDMPMTYEQAKALVKEALAPMGEEYAQLLDRAYNERWIDVCENRGKTSGAYSWGAYGTHPYVLLNYQDTVDYAFTLAHELGHAMHSYYSDTEQEFPNAAYKIMVAEVASTVNEVLLMRHLLQKETDPQRKAYFLNHFLEQFRTTVYRQTMFAEFEKKAHAMCENGEPLTVESLSDMYRELNETYYQGVVVDDQIAIEWMRIPHFYNAFYVYQYATGFCSAVAIAESILKGEGLAAYQAFLKSGGSDYPIALLQRAGVDLTKKESITTALDVFESTVQQLKELL